MILSFGEICAQYNITVDSSNKSTFDVTGFYIKTSLTDWLFSDWTTVTFAPNIVLEKDINNLFAVGAGAAIVGVVWGVGQLFYGNEINGWIDNNFGY